MHRQATATERSTTAEQSLTRTVLFLRTVATDPEIWVAMATTGFTEQDVDEGWRLLRAACSAPVTRAATRRSTTREDAERALVAFSKTMMPRARAALRRLHPPQEAFLFEGLPNERGAAVARVATFVDRCEAMARSKKRAASRKEDRAALAALRKRGVTAAALAEAKENVRCVTTARAPNAPAPRRVDGEALERLHAWLKDWSDCARTVIARRDWLIRLGIGRRQPRPRAGAPAAP